MEKEIGVLIGKVKAERPKTKNTLVAPIYMLPNVQTPALMLKLGEKNLVQQFAERLKEKLEEYRLENEYFIKDEPNGNLWQLNASVFCIEVTQDGGLVDETLEEFMDEP